VLRLLREGAKVRVVDNLERGRLENLRSAQNRIKFHRLDLMKKADCEKAVKDMEIVFHLASKVGGIKYYMDRPMEVMAANLLIDTQMYLASIRAGVQRYFYASSAHVYPIELQQSPDVAPLKEEDAVPANPHLTYGWSKLIGEKLIEAGNKQQNTMRTAVVRLIGVYGKNQDIDLESASAIPVFIRRAIEYPDRKPFVVWGTGEETRSYCYIDDVVNALLLCIEMLDKYESIGPINLGSEERISITDLLKEIVQLSGKQIELVFDQSKSASIWGQAVDCSKARKILGVWGPQTSLPLGLNKTYKSIESRIFGQRLISVNKEKK
jgi:GDP-D-mannose 3',5'-epimerase